MQVLKYLLLVLILSVSLSLSANELSEAVKEVEQGTLKLGPISACFEQMKMIGCPIMGQLPVIKDIIGALALELGMSCPTGDLTTVPK